MEYDYTEYTGNMTGAVRERETLLKYVLFPGKKSREDNFKNFYLRRNPLWSGSLCCSWLQDQGTWAPRRDRAGTKTPGAEENSRRRRRPRR